ncbi:cytochrome P450 [Lasiosphaeria hispida]|uniref:Cytochrome P450 n=1 Tax=Lasiosphaeria hispida TaxID=260671 RepID=A0AAJ0HKH0_9PEZI|nr:cytochrome P450 [Lasiosphaeria hispida]
MDATYYLERLLRLEILVAVLGVYLAQLVAYKTYQFFIYPYFVSPLRHLPGPKDHHFLIGHTLNQFRSGSPNEPFLAWMRQWPNASLIRYFNVGNSDAVLVTSLAAHKEILRDKAYSFQKPAFFTRLVSDIVGFGLVFAEGEEHKKQRRVLAGLFSPSNLRALVPVFRDKARHLSYLLDQIIETEDGVVELVSLYSKIMLDIMGVFALGVELDNLRSANTSNASFDECYHELFEPDGLGQLLMAINGIVPIRWLPVEANRRFIQANKTVRSQLTGIIQDRIRTVGAAKAAGMDGGPDEGNDLLTFMVAEKYYADSDRWTEDDIMNQILTFLAAGHETTAGALTWATQLMIEHPSETKRLRTEITTLLQRDPSPDQHTIDTLPYLHNFTREVLRLQCPAVNVAREAAEDVVIQGVAIPKGTTLMMQPAVVQRNPSIWGPDCDEFRPDRWDRLEGPAEDPWAFTAFSLGPRVCIGKAMTMLEFKIILIELVSGFDLEAVGDARMSEIKLINPSPLLRPEGGIRVRVRRVEEP